MNYTLSQLKKLAQVQQIKGRSKMNKDELYAALNLDCETAKELKPKNDEAIFFDYCITKIKDSIKKREKFAYLRFFELRTMEFLSLEEINKVYLSVSAHFFNKSTFSLIFENNSLGADIRIYDLRNYSNYIKHANHEYWINSILSYFEDEIKNSPTGAKKIKFDESISLPMGYTINNDYFYYEVSQRMKNWASEGRIVWRINKNKDASHYLCKF